ncbi:MAG: hypothetical protein FWF84_04265, partial [Kiritimatiellaeota bacterium]|nr:hypothetical protein [Kiritimatiellota bacterium]
YLEVKSTNMDIIPRMKEYLDAAPHATPDTIRIISFDKPTIAAVRQQLPDYTAVLLVGWPNPTASVIADAQACHAHGVSICTYLPALTSGYIQAIHDAGLQCHVWTVNSLADATAYHERGIDSITSDAAGELRWSLIDALGYIYTVTCTAIEVCVSGQVRLAFDYEGALDITKVAVRQWCALDGEDELLIPDDVMPVGDGMAEIFVTPVPPDAPAAFFRIEVEK